MNKKSMALKKFRNIILLIILILAVLMLISGLMLGIYIASITEKEFDESMLDMLDENTASKIYYYADTSDRDAGIATELDGQELFGGYRSKPVEYEEIPENLVYAFVSIEDKRFFKHSGVDWKRTVGAGFNYVLHFNSEFGGSTITQQLIKNVTGNDEYSLERKLQEIVWALDLETKISKEEILENYLNIINLSNGCYGVGAAAEYYFSKDVKNLDLLECASIAAITNNPSYYDPKRNPENNHKRALLILSQMRDQGYISNSEYEDAAAEKLQLKMNSKGSGVVNLWYIDMVIDDIINDLVAEYGYTPAMANVALYRGGLKIYTAMDYNIQLLLEKYYSDPENFGGAKGGETPQSAMIIIDQYSGDILGVAGAIGRKNANRLQNFATNTVRPAGSVIKPLSVYAPAFEEGIITWSSVYDDVPVKFNGTETPVAWPKNASGVYRGLTNINYAIAHSLNTVTVRVLGDLGLQKSFDYLHNKFFLKSIIEQSELVDGRIISDIDYAALALGQFNYGVTVREISAAYSVFSNKGICSNSRSYYKVTDKFGNIVLENPYHGEAVISRDNAIVMNEILKNVIKDGTATGVTLSKTISCAGKTGTTQNNCDRWFIGYTPYCIGGVWYGYEYPKELDSSSSGICVKIWNEVMTSVYKKYYANGVEREFDSSDNIEIHEFCKDSGKLVGEACKRDPRGDRTEKGYFVKGTEPVEKCDCHVLVKYDNAEGGISAQNCYSADIDYVGLIKVERKFPKQIYVTDAQYVWRELPPDVMPETSPSLPFFNNLLKEDEYCGISRSSTQFNRYCRAHFDYWKWNGGGEIKE